MQHNHQTTTERGSRNMRRKYTPTQRKVQKKLRIEKFRNYAKKQLREEI